MRGIDRDNGNENGSDYLGFRILRVRILGFRVLGSQQRSGPILRAHNEDMRGYLLQL